MLSTFYSVRNINEKNILKCLFIIFILLLILSIKFEKYWIMALPFGLGFIILLHFQYRLLYWLMLFSIAFSITLDFNKRLSTDFPTEFISIGLTVIFWTIYMVYKPLRLNYLWNHKILWCILAIWLWSVVSSLQAIHFLIAAKYVVAKVWYITAFFIFTFFIIRGKSDIEKIFWALYIPVLITSIYSFIRTVLGNFSFEYTNLYSLPFYDNHVIYATTMTLMLPFVYVARQWYLKGSLTRTLLNISIPFLLIATYFSYTRACYLAILAGLFCVLLLKWRKLLLGYVMAIIIVISVLCVFSYDYLYLRLAPDYNTTVMHDEFKDHLVSTFYGKDASSMERLNMWVSVFRMYQERPLAGFGPNNFPSTYKPYSVMYFKTWVSDNVLNLSCHNYFWLLLSEQGLIGLFLFLLFLGYVIYLIQKLYHSSPTPYIKSLLSALAAIMGIFLVILFFNDLIETSKNGSLFFIFLAILIKLQQFSQKNESESSSFF